jgi:aminoglycoside phosphotransferase (APT) family kinase protein
VEPADRKRFYLHVSDIGNAANKRVEFECIQAFQKKGVPVSAPVCFAELEQAGKCVQLFVFVEGEDGEDALPRLSPREQYEAGKQAGMALKTIHSLVKASPDEAWEVYRWRKYERYLKEFELIKTDTIPMADVHSFVLEHRNC